MVVIVGEVFIVAAGDTGMLPWRAAFTPFYLLFILSCSVCFWSVWKCRSCEVGVATVQLCVEDDVMLRVWVGRGIPSGLVAIVTAVAAHSADVTG